MKKITLMITVFLMLALNNATAGSDGEKYLSKKLMSKDVTWPQKYNETNDIGKLPLRGILEKNGHDLLVGKQKLGFNVNTINLWKNHGHNLCKEFLNDSRAAKDGWINNDWIQKYIDYSELDIKYVNKFFGILAFEIWYRLFVTKEMNSNTTLD